MKDGGELKPEKKEALHSGHRRRMMERFEADAEHFQDHEILEVILYNAIPRSNTNPVAHALIRAFGSLAAVFRASVKELMLVDGIGKKTAEYIRCIGLCYTRINSEEPECPLYFSPKAFGDYLERDYKGNSKEILEIFCLNKLGRMYFRKEFSSGKNNEVKTDPARISEILLVKNPHTVVVAHNHPNGTRAPSLQDDVFTKQLYILCAMHNVRLGDHIIVGDDGLFSYHATGALEKIKESCSDIQLGGGKHEQKR